MNVGPGPRNEGPKAQKQRAQGPGPLGPLLLGLGPWVLHFWALGPLFFGPRPKTDIFGSFLRGTKRFWPLRPPIGRRFDSFAITWRGLTVSGDGLALKRPMARDRHPAIFRILGPPLLWPYYSPVWLGQGADQGWAMGPGTCLLYTSPSPRDKRQSRMPSSA